VIKTACYGNYVNKKEESGSTQKRLV
jgi:hypothetical protein